jgi:hypothetical protein
MFTLAGTIMNIENPEFGLTDPDIERQINNLSTALILDAVLHLKAWSELFEKGWRSMEFLLELSHALKRDDGQNIQRGVALITPLLSRSPSSSSITATARVCFIWLRR